MNILLAGGAGYIGRHAALALSARGFTPHIYDNFSNCDLSDAFNLKHNLGSKISITNGDIRDSDSVFKVLVEKEISAVINFAALKDIRESFKEPISYYDNNVGGMFSLLSAMGRAGCYKIIFSSTAAVYDPIQTPPFKETDLVNPQSPYGFTKFVGERILKDLRIANKKWKYLALRYFNPIGFHEDLCARSSLDFFGKSLFSEIVRVAWRNKSHLDIFGSDYPTHDGTGLRDYIHVMDVADAHAIALEKILDDDFGEVINLGRGRGYTVLDLVKVFEVVNKLELPKRFHARRLGDVAISYCDSSLAAKLLDWRPQRELEEMVALQSNRFA